MYVGWQNCEFGAPEIDPKRPYGNSDVIRDIAEILGIGHEDGEFVLTDEEADRCESLHKETKDALQIVLSTGKFETGVYRGERYGSEWEKA